MNTRETAKKILAEFRSSATDRDEDELLNAIHGIIERQHHEDPLPDGREKVYFIDEEDFGEGLLAHSLHSAHQWFDAFWENLGDREISIVRFQKQAMTKAEIDAMPEI